MACRPCCPDDAAPVMDNDLVDHLVVRCAFPSPREGPVAMAVSGGPDSLALMVLAARAGLRGRAVHVDHGLRTGSGAEAEVVADAASRFGFAFEPAVVHVGDGPDLEERARQARYRALPPGVLTGHTMDDQAETVLLNLLRGAGLDGLAGMRPAAPLVAEAPPGAAEKPATGGRPRRPLLGLRRHETVHLCRQAGLDPVQDPTNSDTRFRRNRVRLELIPFLCSISERDIVPVLARSCETVAGDLALLEEMAARLDPTDARALAAAPLPLARRAVRRWLRSAGSGCDTERHPPSLADVDRVLEVAGGVWRACELSGGRRVSRSEGRLAVAALPREPV